DRGPARLRRPGRGVAGVAALSEDLARRHDGVRAGIAAACRRAGRDPAGVTLVAVSKTQPAEAVAALHALRPRDCGENYAQELRDKAQALGQGRGDGIRWHFIGGLQKNKVRLVVGTAALVQTVDSAALVQALAARGRALGAAVDCLLEVNVGEEPQ